MTKTKYIAKVKHKCFNEQSLDGNIRVPACRQQKSVSGYHCLEEGFHYCEIHEAGAFMTKSHPAEFKVWDSNHK